MEDKPRELKWKATTPAVVKAEGNRKFTFAFSSAAVDRDRDIIDQAGIDLGPFKSNPVVLWAHSYMTPPIGRVSETWIREGKLMGSVEFPPKGTYPLADSVHDLVEAGFINATSIGFSPLEYTYDEERRGMNYKRIELWEVSIVPVPANRDALIEAAGKGVGVAPVVAWAKAILGRVEDPAPALEPTEFKAAMAALPQMLEDAVKAAVKVEPTPAPVAPSTPAAPDPISEPEPEKTKKAPRVITADELKQMVSSSYKSALDDEIRAAVNYHTGRLD